VTQYESEYASHISVVKQVVKEFWQKAASHVVPSLRTQWSLLLCKPQLMPVLIFFAAVYAVLTCNVFEWTGNPKNRFFRLGDLEFLAPYNTRFPGPTRVSQVNPQTASGSVQSFLQDSRTWPTDR